MACIDQGLHLQIQESSKWQPPGPSLVMFPELAIRGYLFASLLLSKALIWPVSLPFLSMSGKSSPAECLCARLLLEAHKSGQLLLQSLKLCSLLCGCCPAFKGYRALLFLFWAFHILINTQHLFHWETASSDALIRAIWMSQSEHMAQIKGNFRHALTIPEAMGFFSMQGRPCHYTYECNYEACGNSEVWQHT